MGSAGRAGQVTRVPGPAGLPREMALNHELQPSPRAVKTAGGPRREEPSGLAGALRSRTRIPQEVPGAPRRVWGSAGPSWRTRRHAGFRGARPPRAPSRPGHLHPAQGAHPCSAARSSRPLPAHGAPRPWVPGARAQQAPRQRGPPGSQPPPSRAEQGGEASPPSSLLRLGRRSGPGALRLRTFHSSFHAPSAGQPLIGSAEPDVNTSLPRRPRPSPFPG